MTNLFLPRKRAVVSVCPSVHIWLAETWNGAWLGRLRQHARTSHHLKIDLAITSSMKSSSSAVKGRCIWSLIGLSSSSAGRPAVHKAVVGICSGTDQRKSGKIAIKQCCVSHFSVAGHKIRDSDTNVCHVKTNNCGLCYAKTVWSIMTSLNVSTAPRHCWRLCSEWFRVYIALNCLQDLVCRPLSCRCCVVLWTVGMFTRFGS